MNNIGLVSPSQLHSHLFHTTETCNNGSRIRSNKHSISSEHDMAALVANEILFSVET